MFIDLSIARVREFRRANGWSILRFAKVAGLTESTIRRIDADNWSPTAHTLRRLETVIPPDFLPVNDNAAGEENGAADAEALRENAP